MRAALALFLIRVFLCFIVVLCGKLLKNIAKTDALKNKNDDLKNENAELKKKLEEGKYA